VAADPHLPSVERQICDADDYPGDGEHVRGNVGKQKLVQILKQEFALVWLDSGAAFELRANFPTESMDTATEAIRQGFLRQGMRCAASVEPGESASEGPRIPPFRSAAWLTGGQCLVAKLVLANWKVATWLCSRLLTAISQESVGSEGLEILSFVRRVLYRSATPL
jgi:hypothetical protein